MAVKPPRSTKRGGWKIDPEAYRKHQLSDSRTLDEIKEAAKKGKKSNLKSRYVPKETVPDRLARKVKRDIASERDIPEDQLRSNADIVAENIDLIKTCISFQFARWRVPEQYKDDMFQDICMLLLRQDNRKLNAMSINKHVNAFVTAVLRTQLYSGSSEFYRAYRKYPQHAMDIDATDFAETIEDYYE